MSSSSCSSINQGNRNSDEQTTGPFGRQYGKRCPKRRKTLHVPAADGHCHFDGNDYPSWLGFDPQKPGGEFKNPFPPIDGDPWEKAMNIVQNEDDAACDGWNADIQNLLVFAGLFSGILTAFSMKTQGLLQRNPEVATVLLLVELSSQLLPNSTVPGKIAAPFLSSPSRAQAFRINCLIFSSLVLSIATALVGIVVLQWIRSYKKPECLTNSVGMSLREARRQAFNQWGVPSIISCLPISLGISFLLFLGGLVDFLSTFNRNLTIVIGVLVLCIITFLGITTFLPALHILTTSKPIYLCAYQSAQSMLCCNLLTKFKPAAEWTDVIAELYNDRIPDKDDLSPTIHSDWLKSSLIEFFRRFRSAYSFRVAYQCFQSIPPHISEIFCLRSDIVREVIHDSKEFGEIGEKIYKKALEKPRSLSTIAGTEFLSLLLLLWNGRLDSDGATHRSELYFRCIRSFSRLNEDTEEHEAYSELIKLWWHHSDNLLSPVDFSRECSSYLTTFLTVLQSEPSFNGYLKPLAFSPFWKLIALQMNDESEQSFLLIKDCLRVFTSWFLNIHTPSSAELALRPMFDHNVFNASPLITKLLDEEPSPLRDFLDIFVDPNNKTLLEGWKGALTWASTDMWNDFLVDTGLDAKYSILMKTKSSFIVPPVLALSSSESNTVFSSDSPNRDRPSSPSSTPDNADIDDAMTHESEGLLNSVVIHRGPILSVPFPIRSASRDDHGILMSASNQSQSQSAAGGYMKLGRFVPSAEEDDSFELDHVSMTGFPHSNQRDISRPPET